MKLSVSIMAHSARSALVDDLVERLQIEPSRVTWDKESDRWDTGSRAWKNYDPDADWHVVIQDDAIVCRDLIAGFATALEYLPDECVASLYLGNNRPMRDRVRRIVYDAQHEGASWVRMRSLIWGVAMAAPVASIDEMLSSCEYVYHPNYDTRIALHYEGTKQWPAYYTWPSLVDHRQVPSLLGHKGARQAHRFLGETESALDVDWNAKIVSMDAPRKRRVRNLGVKNG